MNTGEIPDSSYTILVIRAESRRLHWRSTSERFLPKSGPARMAGFFFKKRCIGRDGSRSPRNVPAGYDPNRHRT